MSSDEIGNAGTPEPTTDCEPRETDPENSDAGKPASDAKAAIDAAIVAGYTRAPPPKIDPWANAAAVRSIAAEPW